MKVSELTGEMLDYWAAKAGGKIASIFHGCCFLNACHRDEWTNDQGRYQPSTDWTHGGPLIERNELAVLCYSRSCDGWTPEGAWGANDNEGDPLEYKDGPTPLIAAMRAFVASVYGAEVPTEAIA